MPHRLFMPVMHQEEEEELQHLTLTCVHCSPQRPAPERSTPPVGSITALITARVEVAAPRIRFGTCKVPPFFFELELWHAPLLLGRFELVCAFTLSTAGFVASKASQGKCVWQTWVVGPFQDASVGCIGSSTATIRFSTVIKSAHVCVQAKLQ